jgi:hypothetical protein
LRIHKFALRYSRWEDAAIIPLRSSLPMRDMGLRHYGAAQHTLRQTSSTRRAILTDLASALLDCLTHDGQEGVLF